MSELTDTFRQRLFELARRKERLVGAIDRLQTEVAHTDRKIEAYGNLIDLEEANSQESESSIPVLDDEVKVGTKTEPTKMTLIRRRIFDIGANGFLPKEIARFVLESGISSHYAFAYNAVKRMKESGELLEDRGRYFPTAKLVEALERLN